MGVGCSFDSTAERPNLLDGQCPLGVSHSSPLKAVGTTEKDLWTTYQIDSHQIAIVQKTWTLLNQSLPTRPPHDETEPNRNRTRQKSTSAVDAAADRLATRTGRCSLAAVNFTSPNPHTETQNSVVAAPDSSLSFNPAGLKVNESPPITAQDCPARASAYVAPSSLSPSPASCPDDTPSSPPQPSQLHSQAQTNRPQRSRVLEFYDLFYDNFFTACPSARPFFRNNLRTQGKMMAGILSTTIHIFATNDLKSAKERLSSLAILHRQKGVTVAQYASLGKNLIMTLKHILNQDGEFGEAEEKAWIHLYSSILQIMSEVEPDLKNQVKTWHH